MTFPGTNCTSLSATLRTAVPRGYISRTSGGTYGQRRTSKSSPTPNFETEVLKSDVPTLVDFWAVWCGPCKQIAPTVDALADQYKGKLKVAKMDVDHHQIVPQQYGVRSIPTLLIFKGGKVVGQLVGAMPRSKLEAEIQKHI